ncbi:MAG: hypothetical protein M3R25_03725, partial [Bacteroidota bacterium]|nr:hypothetical protein [Bacteroidota bacterium]
MKRINSSLSDIYLGLVQSGLKEVVAALSPSSVCIIADDHTASFCLPQLRRVGIDEPVIIIPSGELNKSLETCQQIWSSFVELHVDR